MKLAEAFVEVRVDRAKSRAEAEAAGREAAQAITQQFAQYFSAAVVVNEIRKMVTAASDLEQSIGGTAAQFGEFSSTIDAAAAKSAQAMGLSENAFRTLTTQIGGLLQGLGFAQDEAADKAIELTQLGADLAATYGGTTREAVEALGAALRGEFDPLERYGASLRVSAINAKAVELGLAASTTKVDDNARAQAALAIIQERTANAQGQFGREADTAAGRLARLTAQYEDQRAKIGETLLPVLVRITEVLTIAIDTFDKLPAPVQTAVVAMVGIAAVTVPINNALQAFRGLGQQIGSLGPAARTAAVGLAALTAAYTLWSLNQQQNNKDLQTALGLFGQLGGAAEKDIAGGLAGALLFADLAGKSASEALALFAQTNLEAAKRALETGAANQVSAETANLLAQAIRDEEAARAQAARTAEEYGETVLGATDATKAATQAALDYNQTGVEWVSTNQKVTGSLKPLWAEFYKGKEAVDSNAESVRSWYDVMLSSVDATFALHDAEDALTEQIARSTEEIANADGNLRLVQQAMDSAAEAALELAQRQIDVAEQAAAVQGATLSEADAHAIRNQSLIDSTNIMEGPLRDAVINTIMRLNDIPESRRTDVLIALADGSLSPEEAEALGIDIVEGVAAGIRSHAGSIGDALVGATQAGMKRAQGVMGIESPSKVMAELVGLPMVQGIAMGIINGTPEAEIDAALAAGEISEAMAAQLREDLRAVQAAERVAERIGDAIADGLRDQADAVVAAAEAILDEAERTLDARWDAINSRFSLSGARDAVGSAEERLAEQQRRLAEARATAGGAGLTDARANTASIERQLAAAQARQAELYEMGAYGGAADAGVEVERLRKLLEAARAEEQRIADAAADARADLPGLTSGVEDAEKSLEAANRRLFEMMFRQSGGVVTPELLAIGLAGGMTEAEIWELRNAAWAVRQAEVAAAAAASNVSPIVRFADGEVGALADAVAAALALGLSKVTITVDGQSLEFAVGDLINQQAQNQKAWR